MIRGPRREWAGPLLVGAWADCGKLPGRRRIMCLHCFAFASTLGVVFLCCRNRQIAFVLQFPDEPGKFPRDGNDDFVLGFAARLQFHVSFIEPILHAPRQLLYFWALSLLTSRQWTVDR